MINIQQQQHCEKENQTIFMVYTLYASRTKDTRPKRHQAFFARVNKRHHTFLPG